MECYTVNGDENIGDQYQTWGLGQNFGFNAGRFTVHLRGCVEQVIRFRLLRQLSLQ